MHSATIAVFSILLAVLCFEAHALRQDVRLRMQCSSTTCRSLRTKWSSSKTRVDYKAYSECLDKCINKAVSKEKKSSRVKSRSSSRAASRKSSRASSRAASRKSSRASSRAASRKSSRQH
ncbi:hypothetical protein M514_25198 [Trichuris suis]|uniref:Uncharacterized protein n=1 Tax=Trichuris suis TaxID=68888 RepID=A0A085MZI4_9BILA|nr:hypothetical protein M514_25198 [Trichuris suis]